MTAAWRQSGEPEVLPPFSFLPPHLVVVDVEVVGCGEDGDDGGEARGGVGFVHAVPGVLRLVRANDGQQVVAVQELAHRLGGHRKSRTKPQFLEHDPTLCV